MNLRITTAGAVAVALALAVSPAALAKQAIVDEGVFVCNTASQNWADGTLTASKDDPQGYVHFDKDLRSKKVNAGLVNAASHSHALALCGDGSDGDYTGGSVDDGTGGGYTGGGIGGATT